MKRRIGVPDGWHTNPETGDRFHLKDGWVESVNDEPSIYRANGDVWWTHRGKTHREGDKPAIVRANGQELYYQHGKQHRETGPAVVYPDGKQVWFYEDRVHSTAGPAVVHPDGREEYCLFGRALPKEQWAHRMELQKRKATKVERSREHHAFVEKLRKQRQGQGQELG